MPIDPITASALISGISGIFSGISRGKQDARAAEQLAQQQAIENRRAAEKAALDRAQLQRQGQSGAMGTRLDYLTGAQSEQARLAAQRLAAMDLGKTQDFESLMARRAGLADMARTFQPSGGLTPASRALAAQQPNLLAPLATERYRESVSEGRTQQSLQDYLSRVNELRRDPNLDAESRAALDRLDALMGQELPGVTPYTETPQRRSGGGSLIPAILGGVLAGAGTYYAGRALQGDGGGNAVTLNNRGPNYGTIQSLSGSMAGPTGMPASWRLPQAQLMGAPRRGPQGLPVPRVTPRGL